MFPKRQEADGEGHAADKSRRREDINVHDSKGQADSQGVDAGGQGEKEHGPWIEAVVTAFRLSGPAGMIRLPDHVEADEGQKEKSDPVVDVLYEVDKTASEDPADDGHQGLKAAEPDPHGTCFGDACSGDRQGFAYRDRKGVHGKAYRDQKKIKNRHGKSPFRIVSGQKVFHNGIIGSGKSQH